MACDKGRCCQFIAGLLLIIIPSTATGILVWWFLSPDKSTVTTTVPEQTPEITTVMSARAPPFNASIGNSVLDVSDSELLFSVNDENDTQTLLGRLGKHILNREIYETCSSVKDTTCVHWPGVAKVTIAHEQRTKRSTDVKANCYRVSWQGLQCAEQQILDCYSMLGAHWYGGAQLRLQHWPLEKLNLTMKPYIANDNYGSDSYGAVQERYFFSSKGIGIFIDREVPLHVSINSNGDNQLCLLSKNGLPYFNYNNSFPTLDYTVCSSKNVRMIHEYMSDRFIDKPSGIPNENVLKYPIWSTWAEYKENITQEKVLQFANNITDNDFSCSQVEIDDDWTPHYGDLSRFDRNKFPNATEMVGKLHSMGYNVTVWVHPFINIDAENFKSAAENRYLILTSGNERINGKPPALTNWWNAKSTQGMYAGIVDFTNANATEWFLSELQTLQTQHGIDSFKFDAGEINYLPPVYDIHENHRNHRNPEIYTQLYAEAASRADTSNRQEVRTGARNQKLPVLVRMNDKISTWSYDQGLKTLITTALVFSVIGYPFVLPDMIGGNAYYNNPDQELFARWAEATALMPTMQFSIAPWRFNESILNISRDMVRLHEKYSDKIIKLAHEATVKGYPIMRPLWWIAPEDETAFKIDDEFLLGDDLLVAPVLEKGKIKRDIYFPEGYWHDELRNRNISGKTWHRDYTADLHELPHFTLIKI